MWGAELARSKSSGKWLKEHFSDQYVKQSQQDGYRSRASYKLVELLEKDKLIRPGMVVVDLGAAPGGWSQVAAERVGNNGVVIASDILPMDQLAGVEFIQGDFTEDVVFEQILSVIGNRPVDLVISDMAPNMSGMAAVDIPKSMYLVELAYDLATRVLTPGGAFLTKVFQGEGLDQMVRDMRQSFNQVYSRKPDASRSRSREIYQVCKGFKG
ncbi:SAM-dependent 23S rRNA U2552 2'-O-ribose methyltransferase [Oleiphilus messinensis]|uniref:Ribosomal RNA large subunit methyltransferase E n=1 Tax=Oleiphilus messinensis TaxID=141451 RepID=A0A1Y0I506_9GAMM|nr:SAM-dependent 23S rRNA U2552 2'-O-ribose methyltransferase [Oleiphilus messinensis]